MAPKWGGGRFANELFCCKEKQADRGKSGREMKIQKENKRPRQKSRQMEENHFLLQCENST